MSILERIIVEDKDMCTYYNIINNRNKEWLLNEKNLNLAFKLYQPTSTKGLLLKLLFPYLHKIKFINLMLNIKKKNCEILNDIKEFLDRTFINDYDVSMFGGTPGVHQKVILQISQGDEVKAYCKITDDQEVAELFDKECKTLNYLNICGVENITKVIKRETINEFEVFVQSNVKDSKSRTPKKLNKFCLEFLLNLYEKTKRELPFEKTDYFKMLNELKVNANKLQLDKQRLIIKTIKDVEAEYKKSKVSFCQYHGDFTPWNMAINNNKLVVFDFEYSKRTYPPFLDAYHFFMQTEIFVNHSKIDLILKKSDIISKLLNKYGIHNNLYFKMYLLEIINLYLSRENDDVEEIENMKLRLKVLKSLK